MRNIVCNSLALPTMALLAIQLTSATSAADELGSPQPPGAPQPAGATTTITITMPSRRWELAPRIGVIGGGEVTPKGLLVGQTQSAVFARFDGDYVFHPFLTVGGYALLTSMGYDRYLDSIKTNSDGHMTLFSLGATLKARFALGKAVIKPALVVGYNIDSFSVTEGGATIGASGGGVDFGFSADFAYALSEIVALSAQFGFVSQVSGSVSVDGASKGNDLAFTPKFYLSVGPEFRF